ncbi:cap-specific mRNA (nucleoside-2'-O-)-methyltransferase 2 isoform X2 [Dermochelys coriacea]|uniref:cap-specific mRNA (nucleoside-2'-O-)-methyltransferase 2 isoform X2 n=1 Tax=Dermochelys coriacea TaxID=27794 RepID=UPI0018E7208C|nr:cap-specific mRNA (nucleoside-2'-O-)-methyltransferase 2 isoform X2 [Dermochelys coriacea]
MERGGGGRVTPRPRRTSPESPGPAPAWRAQPRFPAAPPRGLARGSRRSEGRSRRPGQRKQDTTRRSDLPKAALEVKVKMKRQKTIQQFFHSKASKTNQGEEHIKNQEYINMSSEGSSGVSTSNQPEAQIQLPTEESVFKT